MTGSIEATAESKAHEALSQGNQNFHVLAVTETERHWEYVIALPQACWRTGILPGGQGDYTKFGRDMLLRLNRTHHLEAAVGHRSPHTMEVFISKLMPHETPRLNMPNNVIKGLPASVAIIIQTVIFRNHGLFQRFFEYLRRLF